MRNLLEFAKTTLVGGVLVILPFALAVIVFGKVLGVVANALDPLAELLPGGRIGSMVLAALVIVAACFMAGIVASTAGGRQVADLLQERVLAKVPGYDLIRNLSRRIAGDDVGAAFAVCLAETDNGLAPALVIEEHPDGRYTVFVPAVPTPGVGAIYIMAREQVHLVDVPLAQAIQVFTRWGMGATALTSAMRAR
jgi:uncharacterized membrane protein